MTGTSVGLKRVCVYCGSNPGARAEYVAAAQSLGREFARRGIETVYGGGRLGLMGAVADAAIQAGGRVIGVMPQALVDMEVAHRGLTDLRIVGSMHERKALMTALSDAFVILPGGWGTLDELCEALTWAQLNIHHKPCVMWNVAGYYDSFLTFLNHAVSEGFLKPKDHRHLLVGGNLQELFEAMEAFVPSYESIPAKLVAS
jgi:uncharacterized protein (TIGR00730 family)